jgi:hypothetical protein
MFVRRFVWVEQRFSPVSGEETSWDLSHSSDAPSSQKIPAQAELGRATLWSRDLGLATRPFGIIPLALGLGFFVDSALIRKDLHA